MAKETDKYIGKSIGNDYKILEKIGQGNIGKVYKAERINPRLVVACKIIPEEKLRKGWQVELQKVTELSTVDSVVHYISHGSCFDEQGRPFAWVLMDYVDGVNLDEYIQRNDPPLDMAFIENVIRTLLQVLHACNSVRIKHGDLHERNILISNPDKRLIGEPRRVFVSDFGYGGSHNALEPKNDFRQIFSITKNMLRKLNPADLTSRDRIMHENLKSYLEKEILETDRSQGSFVGNPEKLLRELDKIAKQSEAEAASAGRKGGPRGVGDYLYAEALGNRKDEWKMLFVREFLAARDLLSQNNTVLTGARGCGKTMAFRRMTLFMDQLIGQPSGVQGSEHFIGFYFNCRELVEVIPWIPTTINEGGQQQLIHLFHLGWLGEIFNALAQYELKTNENFDWLDAFLRKSTGGHYKSAPQGTNILAHARAFIETEKERCRQTDFGKIAGMESWPLARLDLLDLVQSNLEANLSIFNEMPLLFFLDDYTAPLVPKQVQQVLNTIVFKRRSKLFFKISTEASSSFEQIDLRGKRLELNQDFELIDLATESLHESEEAKIALLERVFKPRIERDTKLSSKDLSLIKLLGRMTLSNNQLAWQMRKRKKRIWYHGIEAFEGMWTSDIRTMIQIFVNMLRDSSEDFNSGRFVIAPEIQDRVYRTTGGEFLGFAINVDDPTATSSGVVSKRSNYGQQLLDVVQAFVNVARYELMRGKIMKNQEQENPKQAFRLEIVDELSLPDNVLRYYEGLVRWHFFMQDWRGKSVRGVLTQRLFLNRILIPYARLTFSSKDNIQMTNEQFIRLLEHPADFITYWKRRGGVQEGPTLSKYGGGAE